MSRWLARHRGIHLGRYLLLTFACASLAAIGACGNDKAATTATPSTRPSPTPSAIASSGTDWRTQARALGALLATVDISPWSYEPRGDLPRRQGQGQLVFICLLGFKDHNRAIAFDAIQFYQGAAATREAKRDGGANNAGYWARNRYPHVQVLPLYTWEGDCPIAIHDTPEGYMPPGEVRAVSAAELAKMYRHKTIGSRWFWMSTDGRFVYGLIQQYIP